MARRIRSRRFIACLPAAGRSGILRRALADATAARLRLPAVDVHTTDAGTVDPYLATGPAHVLLACGVFGNVTVDDARRTIATLPSLLADGGFVIWTRGRPHSGPDPSLELRDVFDEHGFTEVCFHKPEDARFRVGMHRLSHRPVDAVGPRPGMRLFSFD